MLVALIGRKKGVFEVHKRWIGIDNNRLVISISEKKIKTTKMN